MLSENLALIEGGLNGDDDQTLVDEGEDEEGVDGVVYVIKTHVDLSVPPPGPPPMSFKRFLSMKQEFLKRTGMMPFIKKGVVYD